MFDQRTCLRVATGLAVILLATSLLAVPGLAQEGEEGEEDDGDTIVNIDLDRVIDAIEELTDEFSEFSGEWDSTLKKVLIGVFFHPFRVLLQQLVTIVSIVLTNTPTLHPNPAVEEVHHRVLLVTYMLSGLAFAAAGILYMIGPVLGISYSQVRLVLPRLVIALAFGSVSLPLLQLLVDLSDALVIAFAPKGITASLGEIAGLSAGLVIVYFINAWLLLGLVVLFIVRDVYLLFVAAISPIIALAWAIPKTKRYADSFIAGWFTALAMGPLDVLVLRFVFAMLEGPTWSIQWPSNWILGVAGFTLLILVPHQLYGASQAAVGQGFAIARRVKRRYRRSRSTGIKNHDTEQLKQEIRRRRDRRRNRRSTDDRLTYRGDD